MSIQPPPASTPSTSVYVDPLPLFAIIYYAVPPKQGSLPAWLEPLLPGINPPQPTNPMTTPFDEDHVAYVTALRTSRVAIQGGPYLDPHGWLIVQTVDQTAAETIAAADPAVVRNYLRNAVFPWNIKFGLSQGI